MGMFDSIFGSGGSDPSKKAMPYLQQVPGTVSPYYQPYINSGGQALNTLQGQYSNLINNPGGTMNQIGSSYQQSPGYQFSLQQALYGANNASAAGGMAGSPQGVQNDETLATNLANQDYYNYLNHALGLYGAGLEGEQGLNQMGYHASDALAKELSRNLYSEAGLSYAGQASKNASSQGLLGGLFGAGTTLGGDYLLGSMLGGGAGGAASGAGMSSMDWAALDAAALA